MGIVGALVRGFSAVCHFRGAAVAENELRGSSRQIWNGLRFLRDKN